jgi:hypothetical protein
MIRGWAPLTLAALIGCGEPERPSSAPPKASSSAVKTAGKAAKHDHPDEGPHGGALATWGDEEYHMEFLVDHDKKESTVYVLDSKAKNAKPIAAKEITVSLKRKPPVGFTLAAKPQEGDPQGKSSRFIGTHSALGEEKDFEGSILGVLEGTPYAGDFKEGSHEGHDHGKKDAGSSVRAAHDKEKVNEEAVGGTPFERELYLKPGGIYTEKDIAANGNMVPSVKFKGKHWKHDEDLKPGDKICPVTANKSEEACSWIVNGQKYEFCCNPCIDKFIKWAKTTPEKIKPAASYIQK